MAKYLKNIVFQMYNKMVKTTGKLKRFKLGAVSPYISYKKEWVDIGVTITCTLHFGLYLKHKH